MGPRYLCFKRHALEHRAQTLVARRTRLDKPGADLAWECTANEVYERRRAIDDRSVLSIPGPTGLLQEASMETKTFVGLDVQRKLGVATAVNAKGKQIR